MTSSEVCESSAPVGSSARMTFGLGDQRARDRDALLLAARELARQVLGPVGEPDALEILGGERVALPARHALVVERQRDVLDRGLEGDQVEGLEDEADEPAAQDRRPWSRRGRCTQLPVEAVLALVVVVEEAEDVEQRRLAGARGAHDRRPARRRRCRGRCP